MDRVTCDLVTASTTPVVTSRRYCVRGSRYNLSAEARRITGDELATESSELRAGANSIRGADAKDLPKFRDLPKESTLADRLSCVI